MNYVTYAVPFFVLAVLVEFVYGAWSRNNTYRLADTINSLQLGTLSRLRGVLQLGLMGAVYDSVFGGWSLFALNADSPAVWLVAFVAYDLGYYFSHRYGHEWRILWASHVVHHSSEEYNLSTALRQTSTGWLNGFFYLPLYVIGIPVDIMVTVGSLNLIYQFWVHTQHIGKLGPLEWLLVTPSNHRVHHARNPRYVDRNYGGVFIIWDRLFGTFQEELAADPPHYGITRQLRSWNPLWANIHAWYEAVAATHQTPRVRDKIRLWFKSPAWQAPGVSTTATDWQAPKYAPQATPYARWLSFVQFWPHVGAVFALLFNRSVMSEAQVLCCAAWLCMGFYVQGMLLEARRGAPWLEWLRLVCGLGLLLWLAPSDVYLQASVVYLALSALANTGVVRTGQSDGRLQSPG